MKKIVIAVLLALVAAGCSGGNKVGDEGLLDFKEGKGGRLGEIERKERKQRQRAQDQRKDEPTKEPTVKAEPVARTVAVKITAQGFEPFNFNVFPGDEIVVTNDDAQARSLTSDKAGLFDTGMLEPGKTHTFTLRKLGTFNFHDETRPYVVGKVTVVERT